MDRAFTLCGRACARVCEMLFFLFCENPVFVPLSDFGAGKIRRILIFWTEMMSCIYNFCMMNTIVFPEMEVNQLLFADVILASPFAKHCVAWYGTGHFFKLSQHVSGTTITSLRDWVQQQHFFHSRPAFNVVYKCGRGWFSKCTYVCMTGSNAREPLAGDFQLLQADLSPSCTSVSQFSFRLKNKMLDAFGFVCVRGILSTRRHYPKSRSS